MNLRPILLLLMLTACAEGPEPLGVQAPSLIEFNAGETAVLEAAHDGSSQAVTFRWTLDEQPAASTPLLIGASASRLHFTTTVPGEYRLSVVARDATRTSAPAVTRLVVHPARELAGTIRVHVLDASNGQPLPGAVVEVAGLKSATDVDGYVTLSDASLRPPVTVHVTSPVTRLHDHDADPTTAAVEWPWYRGATFVDVGTPELTVSLHPSVETQVSLRGRIDETLFDLIPEVAPTFSLGRGHASGQARVVMIAPLPTEPLEDLQPQHLFTPRAHSSLPANLATDDPSLHALAPFLGIEVSPEGDSLTRFVARVSPGRQTFFVLGGLVTLHLDGVTWHPRADEDIARLGRFETALAFAALVTLDVPAEGLELAQPLTVDRLDELWVLEARPEVTNESATDLFTGETLELARVRLDGARQVQASVPAPVPDPRLEAWQERYLNVPDAPEPGDRLRVPHQTGPADTDLPFHLLFTAATTPAGVLPLGFALVRDMDRTLETTTFRWPEPTGTLAGARFEVVAAARRGLWASEAAGQLVPGDTRQLAEVLDDRIEAFHPARLPHEPSNRWNGLMNEQMGERTDPARLPFDRVRAVPRFIHAGLPGNPGRELVLETQGHARVHTVLSRKYRRRDDGVLLRDDFGLWDIHQPAGPTTAVPLPDLTSLPVIDDHAVLQIEVTATSKQRRVARDTFLIRLP